jgi:hypothetical protein
MEMPMKNLTCGAFFKSVILRYGGITLYRQTRPFFIGIIVGFFLGVALSYLVEDDQRRYGSTLVCFYHRLEEE